MADSPSNPLRRNGKQQSCEACRKQKVKCDHSVPRCNRCAEKGTMCIYNPAPMTSKFRIARINSDSTTKPRATPKRSKNAVNHTAVGPQNSATTEWSSQKQTIMINASPLEGTGFLGPTSYQAILNEEDQPYSNHSTPRSAFTTEMPRTTFTIEAKKLDLGLQASSFLMTHFSLLKNLVRRIYNVGRLAIIPEIIMLAAVEDLVAIFDEQLVHDEATRLRTIVRIFENSYQPIPVTKSMTFDEFCRSITGRNVRWETIGNVLIMASICLIQIPEPEVALIDPERSHTKAQLLSQILEITDHVISLCNGLPLVNELVVCLKYNQMLLASQQWGYTNRWLCSSIGELSSCVFATGMHQMGNGKNQYPDFIDQWRRRCFAIVYAMDKIFATIFGRPPFMNRHYCILEPPQDISNDMNDHNFSQIFRTSNSIDGDYDKYRPASYVCLRFLLSTVREEILELHLGTNGKNTQGRANEILQKLQSIWNSYPSHMKYSPDMWNGNTPCQDILPLLSAYLDYQYSRFLIYRLKVQDPLEGQPDDLVYVAKNILSTILVLNDKRERLIGLRSDFGGVLLPFGLPSAEVLIAELFHQSSIPSISPTRIPRAETIRELTIFVSCLGWATRPGTGHFEFGQTVKTKLTQLLDQLIDQSYNSTDGNVLQRNDEFLDSAFNLNSFVDWDAGGLQDPRFDLFCGSVF